ncbi:MULTISPECIES: hypothetical protein [Rhizobium/Agrobacterium group]|uniref:hypothetical protein n=1 Tax=Rhizobium/Agrobacterium group TaxID=227290 RepID=UPI0007140E82|nr:hypothetical protein [Rhizobium sp. Root483D2]KQY41421.1 hypothetical protein ASD32_15985 [Rhizobium sp. Root483D2]
MAEPFRGNVFIHPMHFDAGGTLVDSDLVVVSGLTLSEAIEKQFGAGTLESGEKHCLVGTVSFVEQGKIFTRPIYRRPW